MVNIPLYQSMTSECFLFRLSVLTNMNAADEITEEQARQFQMDLEICYTDFNRLLSSSG